MNLNKHILSFIEDQDLKDSRLLVAVSGGVDSMVLLHALQYTNAPIHVAHVNYHLRGEDSDLDEKCVVDYCKANSIQFSTLDAKIEDESGIQERARNIRFDWFKSLMKSENLDYIVTAHHLNDQAETVLLNLTRGAGLAGASGMSAKLGVKLKPFLEISKQELLDYAEENSVPFRVDVSNASVKYSRNKIRNQVVPVLSQVNSGVLDHLSDFSKIASQANFLLKEQAKSIWESNSEKVNYGHVLDIFPWIEKEYGELLLYSILEKLGVDSGLFNEVYKLRFSDSGKQVIAANYKIWKDRDKLIFEFLSTEKAAASLEIPYIGNYSSRGLKIEVYTVPVPGDLRSTENTIYLDPEKVSWPLVVRNWNHGDSFQPFGMKGRKKISDLLIQNKVPMAKKNGVVVLESTDDILWVVGVRASELTRVSSKIKYVIKVVITT